MVKIDAVDGHQSKYPWGDWLDGRVWYVRVHHDFMCLVSSIQAQAHNWAHLMGVSVCTRDTGLGVLIQAYPSGSTWKPNLSAISSTAIKKACIDNKR